MERIIKLITDEQEINWRTTLIQLVKSENLDPWDIDLEILSNKFIELINSLQKMNYNISGKIVLTAAILLRFKSEDFFQKHLKNFDDLFKFSKEEINEEFEEDYGFEDDEMYDFDTYDSMIDEKRQMKENTLMPKIPQPRKRKVTVYDLVDALSKALEVKNRRLIRKKEYKVPKLEVPKNKYDIKEMTENIYSYIKTYYEKNETTMTYNYILKEFSEEKKQEKEFKVMVLLPLLHLTNDGKLFLNQENPFQDINIHLNEIEKEEIKNK